MSYFPCRCNKCRARKTLRKHPDSYTHARFAQCYVTGCSGTLAVDTHRRFKEMQITCFCDLHQFPHKLHPNCRRNIMSNNGNDIPDEYSEYEACAEFDATVREEMGDPPLNADRGAAHETPPVVDEETTYSIVCKVEPLARRAEAYLIPFLSCIRHTQDGNQYAGAVLVELELKGGETVDIWLPKKCCSNLDLVGNTICVWHKIIDTKIAEFKAAGTELAYEPEFCS